MGIALQAQLGVLVDEVRTAGIPSDCKHTVLWCLEQLPTLYAKFRQTSESRYSDEITRLMQGVLKELLQSKPISSEAQQLAASICLRLRVLHEELGLPELNLQAPHGSRPRQRKVG